MTQLTIPQIGAVWQQAGGSVITSTLAIAVAMAESDGNPDAQSPTSDYGLWQINKVHLSSADIRSRDWADPVTNAGWAIEISNNGSDWGAWCTAYANPNDCGSIHPLPAPQSGSPAAGWLVTVNQYYQHPTQPTVPAGPADFDPVQAWDALVRLFTTDIPFREGMLSTLADQIGSVRA